MELVLCRKGQPQQLELERSRAKKETMGQRKVKATKMDRMKGWKEG